MFLTQQETGGAAVVAISHDASRAGLDAQLLFQRDGTQVVAFTRRAIGARQVLWHDEQRDAFDARRCIRQARQDEMDDVFRYLVFAIGDENLLTGDAVAAVIGALGTRFQARKVGAGLGFGQVHGA